MAERISTEELNIDSYKQFARTLFGLQQTPFYMLQYKFAEKTAALARDMFLSRTDLEYVAANSCNKRAHDADVIEAAGILANTSLNGWTNYDDIAELANTEVADYLQYVNINKNEPLFRSTANLLSQLCSCNNIRLYGPIFIVLARAFVIIEAIGSQPSTSMLGKKSISYAAQLWAAYHIIQELYKAGVNRWSDYVNELFNKALPILKVWNNNAIITSINFKGSIAWRLDTSVEHNKSDCPNYIEL